MASLPDIMPSKRMLELEDKKIPVPGISLDGLATLLARFPEFRAVLAGRGNLTPETLQEIGPNAFSAVLAAGLGFAEDAEVEKQLRSWPLGWQMEAMLLIWDATLPTGIRPLEALATRMQGASGSLGKVRATSSPKPPKR